MNTFVAPKDRLISGNPWAKRFPKNAFIEMSPEFKGEVGLADALVNTNNLFVVSKQIKEFVESIPGALYKNEVIPIKIIDQRKHGVKEPYFIIHQVNHLPCIDMKKSKGTLFPSSKDEFQFINTMVLDNKKIDSKRMIFRAKQYNHVILVRSDLAEKLQQKGFTGIEFHEIKGYDFDGSSAPQKPVEENHLVSIAKMAKEVPALKQENLLPAKKISQDKFRLPIDYTKQWSEVVKDVGFSFKSSGLNKKAFPIIGKGTENVSVELVHFKKAMSPKEILSYFKKHKLEPGKLVHLIAFAKNFPAMLKKFNVAELGSTQFDPVWNFSDSPRTIAIISNSENGLAISTIPVGAFDKELGKECRYIAISGKSK